MSDDDVMDYCPACNRCGERQHEGAACYRCKGRGVVIDAERQREIDETKAEYEFELWREDRYSH